MDKFFSWLKQWIWIGVWLFLVLVTWVFAYQFSTYLDIADVSSWQVLTKDSFNQLLTNVRSINTNLNAAYNSTTWKLKTSYKECSVVNPTSNYAYNCDWSVAASWRAWTDSVIVLCPSWYSVISWWIYYGWTPTSFRESKPRWTIWWISSWWWATKWQVVALCFKVE